MDRQDWVRMDELQVGERLRTTDGTISIACTQRLISPQSVYNLEINGQHVYQVTDLGILVHNADLRSSINGATGAADAFDEGLSVRRGVDIGIHRPPRHHIFQQEHRAFFAERGFTDIDNYTIALDRATHDAIHKWMGSGPWNEVMKSRILAEEARLGRLLNKQEILLIGAKMRREAGLSHVKIIPFQD